MAATTHLKTCAHVGRFEEADEAEALPLLQAKSQRHTTVEETELGSSLCAQQGSSGASTARLLSQRHPSAASVGLSNLCAIRAQAPTLRPHLLVRRSTATEHGVQHGNGA